MAVKEMLDYDAKVTELFRQKIFPDVSGLAEGDVITGCWLKRFRGPEEVLKALDKEML